MKAILERLDHFFKEFVLSVGLSSRSHQSPHFLVLMSVKRKQKKQNPRLQNGYKGTPDIMQFYLEYFTSMALKPVSFIPVHKLRSILTTN